MFNNFSAFCQMDKQRALIMDILCRSASEAYGFVATSLEEKGVDRLLYLMVKVLVINPSPANKGQIFFLTTNTI